MMDGLITTSTDVRFAALYTIYRESIPLPEQKSKAELAAMVSAPEYRFYVVQDGARVDGFSITFSSMGEGFCLLEYMAVDKGCRRRGLGSELFHETVHIVREGTGAIPILLEVDSDREPGPDHEIRRRRQVFYRRLGCRRIANCAYILPLAGAGPVPEMDLFVHLPDPSPTIQRATLQRWLQVIYRDVYQCSADDPRIGRMLDGVPNPLQLV